MPLRCFKDVSPHKLHQERLTAQQLLQRVAYDFNFSEGLLQRFADRLAATYQTPWLPHLQPRSVVGALLLGNQRQTGLYVGLERLAEVTGCSRDWLRKLKVRGNREYAELFATLRFRD